MPVLISIHYTFTEQQQKRINVNLYRTKSKKNKKEAYIDKNLFSLCGFCFERILTLQHQHQWSRVSCLSDTRSE